MHRSVRLQPVAAPTTKARAVDRSWLALGSFTRMPEKLRDRRRSTARITGAIVDPAGRTVAHDQCGGVQTMRVSLHREPTGVVDIARHYIRDIVYGANDGIITTFAVVAGVTGGALSTKAVLI